MTADHRAAAIVAAATWQPWTPGQPEAAQIDSLLELADRLAAWIAGESHGCSSPGLAAESPRTASNPAPRYADTAQTGERHTAA